MLTFLEFYPHIYHDYEHTRELIEGVFLLHFPSILSPSVSFPSPSLSYLFHSLSLPLDVGPP